MIKERTTQEIVKRIVKSSAAAAVATAAVAVTVKTANGWKDLLTGKSLK